MNQKDKTKFRLSKEWKEFRVKLLTDRANTCELCQAIRKKGLVVHHKDMNSSNYKDLSNPSNYSVLCSGCHRIAHRLQVMTVRRKDRTTNQAIYSLIQPLFLASSNPYLISNYRINNR